LVSGFESLGIEPLLMIPGRMVEGDGVAGGIYLGGQSLQGFGKFPTMVRNLLACPVLGNLLFRSNTPIQQQANAISNRVLAIHPDFDMIQAEQQVASIAGITLGRELGIPVIADFHGVWSEELVALGSVKRDGIAFRNVRALEEMILRESDQVTVVSEEMREFLLLEFGADPSRISVVPNIMSACSAVASTRTHPRRVIFAGMLSPLQNAGLLVKSLAIVAAAEPDVEFFLTDRGEHSGQVKRACKRMGLPTTFFWHESPSEFLSFLASCDIGLLPAMPDLDRRVGYPSKLLNYMSVGLPVVANRCGPLTDVIENEGFGVVTDDSAEDFARGIVSLLRDPKRVQECGARGLELFKARYGSPQAVRRLSEVCERLQRRTVAS
jgi:glycosyltransferase involved in cell wall biosynthesis